MNIKTKLSFQFTFVLVAVLTFYSALLYYFYYSSLQSKFMDNLYKRAKNTAVLLIDVPEINASLLKKIHKSTLTWANEEIAITNSYSHLIFSENTKYLTDYAMKTFAENDSIRFFKIGEKDGVCLKHQWKHKTYNVFVMAYDNSRSKNLTELGEILFWSFLFSIWLSVLLSYLFSKNAIRPISQIVKDVKEINSLKLGNRLKEGKRKDEIEQLAMTFNQMLSDLEEVFKSQNTFVSNASHELRTPLSVMIAETDYFLNKDHSKEEYTEQLSGLVNDLKSLNELINCLLELAQLNRDTKILQSEVRIDEIIFDAIQAIKAKYPDRKIISKIEYSDNEKDLLIMGNNGLLTIGLKNLIENACKFSTEDVIVEVISLQNTIKVIISDKGIGIPINEKDNIFHPFQRASNARFKGGYGIGLALVARIAELHQVQINVESSENKDTQFILLFIKLIKTTLSDNKM
jgi:signal transduction histidine kinase